MLIAIKDFFLSSELKRKPAAPMFKGWDNAKLVCLVVPDNPDYLKEAQKFCQLAHKEVDIVIVSNDKSPVQQGVYLSVHKKNFGITGMPDAITYQKLKEKKYDVVICCDFEGLFPIKCISLLLNTSLLLGTTEVSYSKMFDVSIAAGKQGISVFFEQVLKYLNMIKT